MEKSLSLLTKGMIIKYSHFALSVVYDISIKKGNQIRKNSKIGNLVNISFALPIALTLFCAGVIIGISFLIFDGQRNSITFLVSLFASLGIIYSAYYVAASLREHIHRDRIHRSFQLIKELNSCELSEVRIFIEKDVAKGLSPSEFHKRVLEKPPVHVAVKSLMGLFEDISIAVQEDYADEKVIHQSLGFLIPWAYSHFGHYIQEERRCYSDNGLFCELEKVALAWGSNKYLSTGNAIS